MLPRCLQRDLRNSSSQLPELHTVSRPGRGLAADSLPLALRLGLLPLDLFGTGVQTCALWSWARRRQCWRRSRCCHDADNRVAPRRAPALGRRDRGGSDLAMGARVVRDAGCRRPLARALGPPPRPLSGRFREPISGLSCFRSGGTRRLPAELRQAPLPLDLAGNASLDIETVRGFPAGRCNRSALSPSMGPVRRAGAGRSHRLHTALSDVRRGLEANGPNGEYGGRRSPPTSSRRRSRTHG